MTVSISVLIRIPYRQMKGERCRRYTQQLDRSIQKPLVSEGIKQNPSGYDFCHGALTTRVSVLKISTRREHLFCTVTSTKGRSNDQ